MVTPALPTGQTGRDFLRGGLSIWQCFLFIPAAESSHVPASLIFNNNFSCLPPWKYLLAAHCYLFVGYFLPFSPWMFDILEREWLFTAMRPAHGPSKTNCSITPKWQSMITHCKECKWLPMEWLEKLRVMVVHGWKIDVWFSVITPLGCSLLIHQTTASVFTAVPSKYNWMETRGAVCFLYFPFIFF